MNPMILFLFIAKYFLLYGLETNFTIILNDFINFV